MKTRKSLSSFVVTLISVIAIAGGVIGVSRPASAAAPAQDEVYEGPGPEVVLSPTEVRAVMLSEAPELTDEQRALMEEAASHTRLNGGSTTPAGADATVRDAPPLDPETVVDTGDAKAPGTFTIFQNSSLAGGPSKSQVNEPSVANNGKNIFATYNWYAALSTNGGTSWSYLSPYTTFPSVNGGFCCDQDAFYDPSRDLMFWLLQYVGDANGNVLRLAVSKGQTNLAAGNWYYYDFAPENFCTGANDDWFDFPHLARSNNYLYLTSNAFTGGGGFRCTTTIRLSLNELAAGGAVTSSNFLTTGSFVNYTAAHGATDTFYWARHSSTTSMRVYTWPESVPVGSVTPTDVTHLSYLNTGYDCTVTASGKNPCGFDDDRIIAGWYRRDSNQLGFMWDAAQGTDGMGTYTYPYARVLVLNATTKAVIAEQAIYSPSVAWLVPSSGVNARGHVGGTIAYAGGAFQPACSAWLYDDYDASVAPLENVGVSSGDTSPTNNRWGDYLRTRVSGQNPFQFIGSCYAIEGGTTTPRIARFGRERDTTRHNFASFDGNPSAEIVVYRGGAWLFHNFTTGAQTGGVWTGSAGSCTPAPMDYDGDGGVEPTMFCGGAWHFYNDDGSYNKGIWVGGVPGDRPVPADYDGDGDDDVVLWQAGAWQFYDFATGAYLPGSSVWTGAPPHWTGGTDVPAPMDYDGDGTADFTVYSGGPWHFFNDNGTYNKGIWTGGVAGDIPVAGDYDGDGDDDVVVFRGGAWLFYDFTTGAYLPGSSVWTGAPPHWTGGTSLPAPLDYNGDGQVEFTVFSGGPWHFYNDNGTYNKGIWTGGVAGDLAISRRLLP